MKITRKVIGVLGLTASSFLFSSCVATVRTPPPPARVEVVPVAPSPRHVWIPGHYVRRGRNYIWVNGYYAINRGRVGRYR